METTNEMLEPQGNDIENIKVSREAIDFTETNNIIHRIKKECRKLLIGQSELIDLMVTCILCDGHILLEGVPGIAKTLSAKVLAKTINADFSRIQFTPDLMPADIIGTSIFNMKESAFSFKKGPIFSNIILIDEINRAPAKTQSALFEVMEEKQISFDGITYDMEFPFLIIATQNPIEQEGTYRLPEAQLDRFLMKIIINYPSLSEEVKILNRYKDQMGRPNIEEVDHIINASQIATIQAQLSKVHIENQLLDYIARIVQETRNHGRIYLGASPRASLAIMKTSKAVAMMANRDFVIPDDIQYVAPHILNHRIILTPEAEMSNMRNHTVIEEILKEVEVPR
jgi:MoxR-like ATPase